MSGQGVAGLGMIPPGMMPRAPGAAPPAPVGAAGPPGMPVPPGAPPGGPAGPQGLPPEELAALMALQGQVQPDGSMVFIDAPPGPMLDPTDAGAAPKAHKANLAVEIPEDVLGRIGAHVIEAVEEDIATNSESYAAWAEGVKLLGLRIERQDDPFDGASAAVHPMLKQAVVAFVAIANAEMCPADGPVRCEVIGEATPEVEAKAQRKEGWLNYYLTAVDEGYYADNDQGWLMLALYGSIFRKVFRDPLTGQPRSRFLTPLNLIISFSATGLEDATRVTQADGLSRAEVRRRQLAGYYRDVQLAEPTGGQSEQQKQAAEADSRRPSALNNDGDHLIYECQILLAPADYGWTDPMAVVGGPAGGGPPMPMPEGVGGPPPAPVAGLGAPTAALGHNGGPPMGEPVPADLPLPYTVTVDADTQTVLRMERGWRQGDPLFRRDAVLTHFCFMPGLGVYGWGLLALMAAQTETASTLLRQALNAFTLSSFPGGFRVKGINQERSDIEIGPMQFQEIETGGLPIQQAIMPLTYRDVPPSFVPLLDNVQKGGEALGQISQLQVGEGRQDAPVGTTLALLEQAIRPTAASLNRLHKARRRELRLVARKFAEVPGAKYPYRSGGKPGQAIASDFEDAADVLPVSDPNIPTQVQRLAVADAKLRMAMQSGGIMDIKVALRGMLRTMGTPDPEIDALMPEKKAGTPADVVTEFAWALNGTPLAVGPTQAHEAHLVAHLGQLQTPNLPPPVLQALMAHAGEHLAALYATMASLAVGMPVVPGQPLPPEIEARVAIAVAQSTEQIMAPLIAAMSGAAAGKDPLKAAEIAQKDRELDFKRETLADKAVERQFKAADAARKATETARQDQVEVLVAQEETERAVIEARVREAEAVLALVGEMVSARGNEAKARATVEGATVKGHFGERAAAMKGEQQAAALSSKERLAGAAAKAKAKPAAKPKAKASEGRVK
jgi:hypothetical protein